MYLKDQSLYVSGLVNMASSVSKTISKSYLQADCFEKKNYQSAFTNMYEVPEDIFHLEKYNKSLEKLLKELLGDDKKLIEGLMHWIHMEAGDAGDIYTIPYTSKVLELLGAETGGYGPFYMVENVYFIECDRLVICLLLGNDE